MTVGPIHDCTQNGSFECCLFCTYVYKPFSLFCGPENNACTEIPLVANTKEIGWRAVVLLGNTNRGCKLLFFNFPTTKTKRRAWVNVINRKSWLSNSYSRICSKHWEGWHSEDSDDATIGQHYFSLKIPTNKNWEIFNDF